MYRRLPWLRFVESEPGNTTGVAPVQTPPAQPPAEGFPAGTPLEQMTVEQREAYWKSHARRHESRVKSMGDYDELKAKASELETLKASQMTETEKAVSAARAEGAQQAKAEVLGQNVNALLSMALRVRSAPDAHKDIPDIVGMVRAEAFIKDGVVDEEAILAYADRIVGRPSNLPRVPDTGAGNRGPKTGLSKAEEGRAAARRRHKLPDPKDN